MTTPNEAKEAIYSRFRAMFVGTTNIAFDNEDLKTDGLKEWVRLTVRHLPARTQDTLGRVGNRRFRTAAMVFVQVYTQINTGVKQSDALAKEAADIFDAVSFSGLDFQASRYRETGSDGGKWYTAIAESEFDYDEIK